MIEAPSLGFGSSFGGVELRGSCLSGEFSQAASVSVRWSLLLFLSLSLALSLSMLLSRPPSLSHARARALSLYIFHLSLGTCGNIGVVSKDRRRYGRLAQTPNLKPQTPNPPEPQT